MDELVKQQEVAAALVARMRESGASICRVTVGQVSIDATFPPDVQVVRPEATFETEEEAAIRRKMDRAEFDRVVFGE